MRELTAEEEVARAPSRWRKCVEDWWAGERRTGCLLRLGCPAVPNMLAWTAGHYCRNQESSTKHFRAHMTMSNLWRQQPLATMHTSSSDHGKVVLYHIYSSNYCGVNISNTPPLWSTLARLIPTRSLAHEPQAQTLMFQSIPTHSESLHAICSFVQNSNTSKAQRGVPSKLCMNATRCSAVKSPLRPMMLVCPHLVSASHAVIWNRSPHTCIYVKRDRALGLIVLEDP